MNTQRSVSTVAAWLLVVGLCGGLGWGAAPALGASDTLVIPLSGKVTLAADAVPLVGVAKIVSELLPGDATTPPGVLLSIRLLSGGGTGARGTRYAAIAEVQRVRVLSATDVVEITVPVYPLVPGGINKAERALVTFTLSLDPTTGLLNSGTGKLATANFQ